MNFEFRPVNAANLKLSCKTEPDNCYSSIKGWIPHQNVNININIASVDIIISLSLKYFFCLFFFSMKRKNKLIQVIYLFE